MKLLKELLTENKQEYVLQKYGSELNAVYNYDMGRTNDREDGVGEVELSRLIIAALAQISEKYLVWLARQYIGLAFKMEDRFQVQEDLELFERVKSRLEIKDIGQYTLPGLRAALRPYREVEVLSGGETERRAKAGAEKLYDQDGILILQIKTKEAAMYYGANTRWCTAAKQHNMFDQYNKDGPLFVLIDKKKNKKYQWHIPSGQLMNEEDDAVYPSRFREQYPMFVDVMDKHGNLDKVGRVIWLGEDEDVVGVLIMTRREVWYGAPKYPRDWAELCTYMTEVEWNRGVLIKRVLDDLRYGLGIANLAPEEVNTNVGLYNEFRDLLHKFGSFSDKEVWWGTNYDDDAILLVFKKQ